MLKPDELQKLNEEELADYERKVPMSPAEKRALRKWVSEGHSVMEHPESRYICTYGMYPPPDFLAIYRMDKEIKADLRGKSKAERLAYLKEFVGYEDETPEEKQWRQDAANTPEPVKEYIRQLERKEYYLLAFLQQEGLFFEAEKYLEENMDEPSPFEFR